MTRTLTLVCLFWLIALTAWSQDLVTGTVRDSLTGTPLSYAHVVIPGTYAGTFTDGEGRFSLGPQKSRRVTLRISFLGYRAVERLVELPLAAPLDITLARDAVLTDEVVVTATRANEQHAQSYVNLDAKTVDEGNFAQDLPYLLAATPSAVATSDAGTGIGYTGLRIRGSDASRINVTINGIPVNDAESQLVYWVDLPDLAASAGDIQVQRGVGTSTNGAGAFGGSINIGTNRLNESPYVRSDHAYGSFGTVRNSVAAGTGLLHGRWTFDMRLTGLRSDGYVDRASSDLKSIFITQGFYGKKAMARLNLFSGKEITYQSWYGTPESVIDGDRQAMILFAVRNGLDTEDSLNLLTAGRTYNYYRYHNQVDDYRQDHYQLHLAFELAPRLTLNTALHYTRGKGFYEEYKKRQHLPDYGIDDSVPGFVFADVNLVRRKWLDNDFYGSTWSLRYERGSRWSFLFGGAWNRYLGDHYDEVIWAEYLPVGSIPFGYAFDSGDKSDANAYLRTVYEASSKVSVFTDLQGRRVLYRYSAPGDDGVPVARADDLFFFNPKAGITVRPDGRQTVYLSAGIGNKEPSRNDYVDNPAGREPRPERLFDVEAGYRIRVSSVFTAFNLYRMQYDDQLVLNGSLNDVGEPVRVNVAESYRQGIEWQAGWKITRRVGLQVQATAGRTRIRSYREIVADYDDYVNDTIAYENTSIAYSPDLMGSAGIRWEPVDGLVLSAVTTYVGKQYLDNTSRDDRKLDPYTFTNVHAMYTFRTRLVREVRLGLQVNNVLNSLYESNGYTYSYVYGGETIRENFYYPQAGTHVMGRLTLSF